MALQSIIDRRLSGKNKSIGNRERFLRRYKTQIREAVKRAVDARGIRDIERGEDITIPKKDISEPSFGHGPGGVRELVHTGNQEYLKGDRIERPQGGGGKGSGKGQASDSGEGEDDFVFSLSKEEFMQGAAVDRVHQSHDCARRLLSAAGFCPRADAGDSDDSPRREEVRAVCRLPDLCLRTGCRFGGLF
jgi:hypothetical protein